jgi:hypothetical protein
LLVVFAEFGGERLLGKARELADSLGLRVLAICSSETGTDEFCNKVIALGADEVTKYRNPSTIFEWSEALSALLKSQKQIRFLLANSGVFSDTILGRVYEFAKDRIGSFATGIDSLSENEATKNLRSWGGSIGFRVAEDGRANVFSFKSISVPEPFQDTSRYGKISEFEFKSSLTKKNSPAVASLGKEQYSDASSFLTLLLGRDLAKNETEVKAVQNVASKYKASFIIQSSKIEEIYGPCLAIEVQGWQQRELPRFHEELIAISSNSDLAITRVADTSVTNDNVVDILKEL